MFLHIFFAKHFISFRCNIFITLSSVPSFSCFPHPLFVCFPSVFFHLARSLSLIHPFQVAVYRNIGSIGRGSYLSAPHPSDPPPTHYSVTHNIHLFEPTVVGLCPMTLSFQTIFLRCIFITRFGFRACCFDRLHKSSLVPRIFLYNSLLLLQTRIMPEFRKRRRFFKKWTFPNAHQSRFRLSVFLDFIIFVGNYGKRR